MTTIHLETRIAAPAMRVFLLSLNVDLHQASAHQTNEKAIAGVTSGILRLHDSVTWRARHFGLRLTHTAKITQYSAPDFFEDTMTEGAFSYFRHAHRFQDCGGTTLMGDELTFSSPMGILGRAVDRLILRKYLRAFVGKRNALIREVAESGLWRQFMDDGRT